jgi:uncharacterized protein
MERLPRRLIAIASLLALEMVILAGAFQMFFSFECEASGAFETCRLLRSLVARAVAVFAAAGLLLIARPKNAAMLFAAPERPTTRLWPTLHFMGFAFILSPLIFASLPAAEFFNRAIIPWMIGAAAASSGAIFWLAPPFAWWRWFRAEPATPIILLIAFLIPSFAELAQPAWDWTFLTEATFASIEWLLRIISPSTVYSDPPAYIIGADGFYVHIARQCSGVEGFALVTGFLLLYSYLFRQRTRLLRFWLLVLPVGLALSWALNVVRITALILIGARISPELAVNGFHSYAGWLFFTILALFILFAVQATPWLRTDGAASPTGRLRDDWTAACILPFVAFMLASVAASALAPHPDLAYPAKVLAMILALAVFQKAYGRIERAIDPLAIGAGLAVGLLWIATDSGRSASDVALLQSIGQLEAPVFWSWIAFRLVGSVLLVPIVEELFFRGYVLRRLDRGGPGWRIVAILVSTILFAALHARWFAAGAAGMVFGLLALRKDRLADAITAHMASNFVIAVWAFVQADWAAL